MITARFSFVLALLLGMSSQFFAQNDTLVYLPAINPKEIHVEDMNNDGREDLILLGSKSAVLFRDSSSLTFPNAFELPFNIAEAAILDLDGDEDLDMIGIAASPSMGIYILESVADTFQVHQIFAEGQHLQLAYQQDTIWLFSYGAYDAYILKNTGDLLSWEVDTIHMCSYIQAFVPLFINSDDYLDFYIYTNGYPCEYMIRQYTGSPDGFVLASEVPLSDLPFNPYHVAKFRLNSAEQDGLLIMDYSFNASLYFIESTGELLDIANPQLLSINSNVDHYFILDVDNDSISEIILNSYSNDSISIIRQSESGAWEEDSLYMIVEGLLLLEDLDVIIYESGDSTSFLSLSYGLINKISTYSTISQNLGNYYRLGSVFISEAITPISDRILVNHWFGTNYSFRYSPDDLKFIPHSVFLNNVPCGTIRNITQKDVNLDGINDIFINKFDGLSWSCDNSFYYQSVGTDSFALRYIPTYGYLDQMSFGDINQDGYPDLLGRYNSSTEYDRFPQFFKNDGISFSLAEQFPFYTDSLYAYHPQFYSNGLDRFILMHDYNNLLVSAIDDSFSIAFPELRDIGIKVVRHFIMNNDDISDIIVMDGESDTLYLFDFNSGALTPVNTKYIPEYAYAQYQSLDVNLDGYDDLYYESQIDSDYYLLYSPSEGWSGTWHAMPYLGELTVGDFNNDDIPDVLVATASMVFVDYSFDLDTTYVQDFFTDITVQESSSPIRLHPNPANEHITISFDQVQGSLQHYVLYDLQGQTVLRGVADMTSSFTIDISAVPEGYYLLALQTSSSRFVEKIIVQR